MKSITSSTENPNLLPQLNQAANSDSSTIKLAPYCGSPVKLSLIEQGHQATGGKLGVMFPISSSGQFFTVSSENAKKLPEVGTEVDIVVDYDNSLHIRLPTQHPSLTSTHGELLPLEPADEAKKALHTWTIQSRPHRYAEWKTRIESAMQEQKLNRTQWIRSQVPVHRQDELMKTLEAVSARLSSGAVIVGERYSSPDAQAVILDLVASNEVKNLFVEMPDIDLATLGALIPEKIGSHLRSMAGKSLENDVMWNAYKAEVLAHGDSIKPDAIPLSTTLETAVEHGVNVYFYDNFEGHHLIDSVSDLSNAELGLQKYRLIDGKLVEAFEFPDHVDPMSSKGMQFRNYVAGSHFLQHSAADEAGTVILAGADHLTPDDSEGGYKTSLQECCFIKPTHVFDLSDRD